MTAPTLSAPGATVTAKPAHLAHILLQTTPERFGAMVAWWKAFLPAQAAYENHFISFLTYDDEHHRVAIAAAPGTALVRDAPGAPRSGMRHVAFTYASLHDLCLAYRQRLNVVAAVPADAAAAAAASSPSSTGTASTADPDEEERAAKGIRPYWCVNHGMTTSMYYRDPDGNGIEAQVDNFATADEATAYMLTDAFRENPIGADFDPEELVRRVEAGEDEEVLKRRPDVGPRGLAGVSA